MSDRHAADQSTDIEQQSQGDVTQQNTSQRHMSRLGSVKDSIKKKTANFFKIVQDEECQGLWEDRQKRLLARTCGQKCPHPKKHETDVIEKPHTVSFSLDNNVHADGTDAPCPASPLMATAATAAPYRTPVGRKSAIRVAGDSIKKQLSPKTKGTKDVQEKSTRDVTDGFGDAVNNVHGFVQAIADEDKDTFDDHRPFFTYFLILSQTTIMALSLLLYGFGPWGMTHKTHNKQVLVPSMSLQYVEYKEPHNFWIGPPATALIHLGAKFAPCMRKDRLVYEKIHEERMNERNTACCIRTDDSGCAQTTKEQCSTLLSTWNKWGDDLPGPDMVQTLSTGSFHKNRTSGTVCGQDPRFCASPASQQPFEWPDDITAWPICRDPSHPNLADKHMTCEVIAKPCCIGVTGQCHITTQDYCEFVNGVFHEEASLCSQVSCMSDVCGLLPFVFNDKPDQITRVFTSTFLHAGLIHLACSLTFYVVLMRDIERAVGPLRLGIIYIASGVAGNLASAAFVPYRAEVGPAGSILGVMACLVVIIIYHWKEMQNPYEQIVRKLTIIIFFFIGGLLFPWIDNYAHLGGFIVGFFLSLALIPFVNIGRSYDQKRKKILIWVGFSIFIVTCLVLTGLFYYYPIYDCEYCKYVNCLLSVISDDLCPDQDFKVSRMDIL